MTTLIATHIGEVHSKLDRRLSDSLSDRKGD